MTLRAVSAKSSWLTPLAVLVPILATVIGAVWALTFWPPLILLIVAGGLAVTAVAGQRTYGARPALVVAGLTLVVAPVALFLAFVVGFNTSICGKAVPDRWLWVPFAGGALAYFIMGTYGFLTDRATAVVPLSLLFGVFTMLVLLALVPGTHGYCD